MLFKHLKRVTALHANFTYYRLLYKDLMLGAAQKSQLWFVNRLMHLWFIGLLAFFEQLDFV